VPRALPGGRLRGPQVLSPHHRGMSCPYRSRRRSSAACGCLARWSRGHLTWNAIRRRASLMTEGQMPWWAWTWPLAALIMFGTSVFVGLPKAVVGILVAALVLMPESLAAVRAPRANRLQTSMNFGARLRAGNDRSDHPGGCDPFNRSRPAPDAWPRCQGGRTPRAHAPGCGHHVRAGRTTVLQSVVHLVIFAAFLSLAVVP
jgi:hypothetical protein